MPDGETTIVNSDGGLTGGVMAVSTDQGSFQYELASGESLTIPNGEDYFCVWNFGASISGTSGDCRYVSYDAQAGVGFFKDGGSQLSDSQAFFSTLPLGISFATVVACLSVAKLLRNR